MCFSQDETGKMRKLSQPWHGPYKIVSKNDPDVTFTFQKTSKSRFTKAESNCIQSNFPKEIGNRRCGRGLLTKRIQKKLIHLTAEFHKPPTDEAVEDATNRDVYDEHSQNVHLERQSDEVGKHEPISSNTRQKQSIEAPDRNSKNNPKSLTRRTRRLLINLILFKPIQPRNHNKKQTTSSSRMRSPGCWNS